MQRSGSNTLAAILKGKCPTCGNGNVYVNSSVFPLKHALKTADSCSSCQQSFKTGNDSAPGINYAISVIVYALAIVLYALLWGITYKDNSFIHAFIFSTVIVILLQPWLMRLSKTIYIYLFTKFH